MKNLYGIILSLGICMPLSALGLPAEFPLSPDCTLPWAKPETRADAILLSGWAESVNRYLSCLDNYRQQAVNNLLEYAEAGAALTLDARKKDVLGELSDKDFEEYMSASARYIDACNAWRSAATRVDEEVTRFARRNHVKFH